MSLVFCLCSYNIPLVADIHFAPTVALRVAECFDKIRVNPGNFGTYSKFINFFLEISVDMRYSMKWFLAADRRAQFEKLDFTDEDYQKELEHIEQVKPLI